MTATAIPGLPLAVRSIKLIASDLDGTLLRQRQEVTPRTTAAIRAAFDAGVKLRYRQPDQAARVTPGDDGCLRIDPQARQRAVTPGQSAVFYDGARCLGGGVITQTDI